MKKLFILVLFLACFIVYFNSLNNDFVLDDESLIVTNPFVKSLKFLSRVFQTSPFDQAITQGAIPYDIMYRPLQILSYAIDYKIWGLKAFGFHLTNILIHFANSLLIYILFFALFNSLTAKITSLLFAIHPVHTSVVSYISGRADLLASFFMLLSIILFFRFVRTKKKMSYALSLFSAVLALLSRENAIFLFAFILLLLCIIKARPRPFLYCLPFIVLNFCYLFLRIVLFGSSGVAVHPDFVTLPLRALNFFNLIWRYLCALTFPFDLHLFRATSFIKEFREPLAFFALGFILLYFYLLVKFRKNKLLFFALSWFLLGLIPVFFYLDGYPAFRQAMMAESWVYFSSPGFFALFTFSNNLTRIKRPLWVSALIFYGVLTIFNNGIWKNNIVLYNHILAHTPKTNILRKNLINAYLEKGLYEQAHREIEQFSLYYPDSDDYYIYLGNYYYGINKLPEAIENFNQVLSRQKNQFAYYDLSLCYQKLQQLDQAVFFASEAVKLNPRYLQALILLGDLYRQLNQPDQARNYYESAYKIDPANQALREKLRDAK